jgi:hypothetical protein
MKTKTKTKTRKQIKTKAEIELARRINFRGQYVDSLRLAGEKYLKIAGGGSLLDVQSILQEINRRHAAAVKSDWGMSPASYKKLRDKAAQILRGFTTGYSMGEVKKLVIGEKPFLTVDNTREYARSSKYTATHGELIVTISLAELRKIECVEGVWTVRLAGGQAQWLRAKGLKGNCRIGWVKGYLVGSSHGATLDECQLLEAGKATRGDDGKIKRFDRFIGLRDRVAAGACEAGVLAFCERHGLNPDFGYRIDYLLSLKDDLAASYLNRVARLLKR